MNIVYTVSLIIGTILSFAAIFGHYFDDNIMQRLGLSLVGFAACVELYLICMQLSCCHLDNARQLFVIGFVVFGIGTSAKVYKHRKFNANKRK